MAIRRRVISRRPTPSANLDPASAGVEGAKGLIARAALMVVLAAFAILVILPAVIAALG